MFRLAAQKLWQISGHQHNGWNNTLARHYSGLVHQKVDNKSPITTEDIESFMNIFPSVVADLKDYASNYGEEQFPNWIEKVVKYNVGFGKNVRGLTTVLAFKELANKPQQTSDNIQKAQRLGWCVELLTGALMMLDDIMDGSDVRRRKPCWYTLEDVGMQAINDSMIIENGLYAILQKYFGTTENYGRLSDSFRQATFLTCLGQTLDLQASRMNVLSFTMDNYKAIVRAKSSYGSFSLHVSVAMQLCGISDPMLFTKIENILFEICYHFQAHNDIEDCYADPGVAGRIGTDIEANRCTWLAVTAVERASAGQKKILAECYGHKDPEKVAQVRQVYEELNLLRLFAAHEKLTSNYIRSLIKSDTTGAYSELLLKIWDTCSCNAKPATVVCN